VSDIIGVEGADTFVRPIYAGNALATVKSKDAIKVITVRTTGVRRAAATGGSAPWKTSAPPRIAGCPVRRREEAKSERPELTSAASSSPAGAAWARERISRSSSRSPTS
jgi:electron transfer flavoprotein alpha subunit